VSNLASDFTLLPASSVQLICHVYVLFVRSEAFSVVFAPDVTLEFSLIETFIYQLVSYGIMNTQINLRMPQKLLSSVRSYSDEHGFGSVQDFIKETIREKLFDEPEITKEELELVKKLVEVTEKKKLYGTEKELFAKLRRR